MVQEKITDEELDKLLNNGLPLSSIEEAFSKIQIDKFNKEIEIEKEMRARSGVDTGGLDTIREQISGMASSFDYDFYVDTINELLSFLENKANLKKNADYSLVINGIASMLIMGIQSIEVPEGDTKELGQFNIPMNIIDMDPKKAKKLFDFLVTNIFGKIDKKIENNKKGTDVTAVSRNNVLHHIVINLLTQITLTFKDDAYAIELASGFSNIIIE